MASAAGYVILAGGIAAGNELLAGGFNLSQFNWRIIPATGVLALLLEGLDKVEPGFGKGLAVLVILGVFIIPVSGQPTPLDSATRLLNFANAAPAKAVKK